MHFPPLAVERFNFERLASELGRAHGEPGPHLIEMVI
jgi:hypothetical protein